MWFVFGILIGFLWAGLVFRMFLVGTLRIDRSDPTEAPYMFLELSKPTSAVTSKSYVILKVRDENYIR